MNVAFLKSLQARVALVFLLVSTAPLSIVGWFAVRTADDVLTATVTSQLENVASEKQDLLERWIVERKADLGVVAQAAPVRSLDPKQAAPYLKLVRDQYRVYTQLLLTDRDGRTLVCVNSVEQDGDPASRRPVPDASNPAALPPIAAPASTPPPSPAGSTSTASVSEVRWDESAKAGVFQVREVVRDEAGAPRGTVVADVGTQAVLGSILRISLGETGECYLVDRTGTFLAHKEPHRVLKENIAQSESFANLFGRSRPTPIYTDYRGIPVLGASRPVRGTEWYIVVEQDRDEAFAGADLMRRNIGLMFGLTAAGAIGLSWLSASYLTRPIRMLGDAAEALSQGDFQTAMQLSPRRSDELGALDEAFHRMADRIFDRHTKMEHRIDYTEEELRKSEAKLKETIEAAARAEHLAALGRLASGVAHEIRTPLASLKLFLQSLREETDLTPEQAEDFEVATRQVRRMETTINHFLQFARPQEPSMTDIDFAKLIDDTVAMARPRASRQGVEISRTIAPELPPVRGDMHQLSEVLLNLLVNSLEVMPDGGRITVTLSVEEGVRRWVRLEVVDTGPGIDEEDLDRVFEPFFTTKASGSGLGLAAVRSIVTRHGGAVSVRTQPEAGAAFTVLLPEAAHA